MDNQRVLDVHNHVGVHVAVVPSHRAPGRDRDAHVHHGFVEHAGPVHHRRVQTARTGTDAGHHQARVLARRPSAIGRPAVLAIRALVRHHHARGQFNDVLDARHLDVHLPRNRLAGRAHISHVDAVDANDAGHIRCRVRHTIRRVADRTDQHHRHGIRHGADRHRDESPGGHVDGRYPRAGRGSRVRYSPFPCDRHSGTFAAYGVVRQSS